MNSIVLKIFQADGSTESFELQPGANQLIPQATDKYRISNDEGDTPAEQAGAQWAPTVWRDGTDLIIDSPKASTTLTIKEYFAVCDEAGECPVEIAPAGAAAVVVDPATLPLQTIADGRSLLADFSPLAELTESSPGVGKYLLGGLGTVAVLALGATAINDNEDSGGGNDVDDLPIEQVDDTPDAIRIAGDNVTEVTLEGDDQIVSASEAGTDNDPFEIVLTVEDGSEEINGVRLYWDYGEQKEYVRISDANIDVSRPSDSTIQIDVQMDQREGPNGATLELDDLVELDIVLVGDNPDNPDVPDSRIDIPLDIQIRQGNDADSSVDTIGSNSLLPNLVYLPTV